MPRRRWGVLIYSRLRRIFFDQSKAAGIGAIVFPALLRDRRSLESSQNGFGGISGTQRPASEASRSATGRRADRDLIGWPSVGREPSRGRRIGSSNEIQMNGRE
jgi:hypothetical protein